MAEFPLNEVIAILVSLLSLLIAWWQNRQKNDVITFFTDPVALPEATNNQVLAMVPQISWKMSPETLKWILFGESDEDQKDLKGQIFTAEAEGLTSYTIRYSKGFYKIEWGLIKSSGREK